MMDPRVGYSHTYELLGAELDEINSRQIPFRFSAEDAVFEMRTEFFTLRTDVDAEFSGNRKTIIGSERFDVLCTCYGFNVYEVEYRIKWRLEEYWMSEDEMQKLCKEATEFSKQRRASQGRGCVAVILRMEVLTVQREGEPLDQTKMRAVLPGKLTPLHVWRQQTVVRREMSLKLMDCLFNLARRRPDPDSDSDAVCSICVITHFNAAFITKLEHCGCSFHSHCIIRKLERDNKCPNCRHQVYDETYLTAHSEEEWWWETDDLYDYGVLSY